jgi:hypothetical protein
MQRAIIGAIGEGQNALMSANIDVSEMLNYREEAKNRRTAKALGLTPYVVENAPKETSAFKLLRVFVVVQERHSTLHVSLFENTIPQHIVFANNYYTICCVLL